MYDLGFGRVIQTTKTLVLLLHTDCAAPLDYLTFILNCDIQCGFYSVDHNVLLLIWPFRPTNVTIACPVVCIFILTQSIHSINFVLQFVRRVRDVIYERCFVFGFLVGANEIPPYFLRVLVHAIHFSSAKSCVADQMDQPSTCFYNTILDGTIAYCIFITILQRLTCQDVVVFIRFF